jgi:hypothetical protein
MTKPHYLHLIRFGGFFFMQFMDLLLNPKFVFISLQGLISIVSEQQHRMSGLIKTYCQMTGMLGPLTSEQIVSRSAKSPAAVSGSFFLSYDAACLYLENLGVWVLQSVDSLTIEDLNPLLNSVGQLFVDAAEGISKVINVDDYNSRIGLSSNLPPVLPCELAKIDMRMFAKLIQNHHLHLVTHFNDSGLE